MGWTHRTSDVEVEHRCFMNKTLRARIHLKVAELQLPLHKNFTSEFLNREDNSRDLLGKHWQDKTIPHQSKRRLLQSIGHQFPCTKLFKLWGLRESDKCRLCKRLHPEVTPWPEASAISKLDARLSENQESRYIMASGMNYLQPSVGTPWRPTTTARGNGTFRQGSARLPTTSGQSVKLSDI